MPNSWVWTNINSISKSILYGVSESAKTQGEYKLLRITDIQENIVNWNSVPYTDYDSEKASLYLLKNNDILFARTGATVGKSYLVTDLKEKAIFASYLIRVQSFDIVRSQYIKFFFESGYYWQQIADNSVGTGQPNVNGTILGNLKIPIAPLKEQDRIIIEVKKWFSLIDLLEKEQTELKEAIKHTKAKVLDLAIHGKLVPQDDNDEPAIELLKRINPKAENACDNGHSRKLPQSWSICKLNQVCLILDNKRKPINSREREKRIRNKQMSELYPYYGATGQVGYIDNYLIDGHYLLIGEDGAPFLDKYATKAYSINGKSWVNNHVHIIEPQIDFDYLLFYLNQLDYSPYVNGSTRLKLTQSDMKNIIVFLPPLEEQKRIARKVKEIFLFLNQIQDTLEAQ